MNRTFHSPEPHTPDTALHDEWILVANAARARLLLQRNGCPLRLIQHFEHPQSRLHAQDLADDQTGRRASDRGHGAMALAARSDPHRKQAERFAQELARHLEQAALHGQLGRLLVFAAPPFLSLLRRHCGPATRRQLGGMFNVDLSGVDTAQLAQRLVHERAQRSLPHGPQAGAPLEAPPEVLPVAPPAAQPGMTGG